MNLHVQLSTSVFHESLFISSSGSFSKRVREKKKKAKWQRLKKNIKKKRIGRGHPSQHAASAVPWEGQPCFKELIFLLLFQETLKPKCNGQLTHCTKLPSAAGTAAQDEPGPASGTGRQRGDRREQRGNTSMKHQG